MTRAEGIGERILAAIKKVGVQGTLTSVSRTYDSATSKVTETAAVGYSIDTTDLIDEAKRYSTSMNVQEALGTFYVAAASLTATPKPTDRVTYLDRTFSVIAVSPYRMNGQLIAWRLDVGEIGT